MFKQRTTAYYDDFELPFNSEPVGEVKVEIIGRRAVIGYLLHDEDCPNPMRENDGEGTLYTHDQGVITDNTNAALSALGLREFGSRFCEIQPELDNEAVFDLAVAKLRKAMLDPLDADFVDFVNDEFEPDGPGEAEDANIFCAAAFDEIDWGPYGPLLPEWLQSAFDRYAREAWDELFAQGKVGEYLAVPVSYYESNHGPGTTSAHVTDIGSANAVWVPDACCIENIKAQAWQDGIKIEWKGSLGSLTEPLHAVVTHHGGVVGDFLKWGEAQAYVDANYGEATYGDLYVAAEKCAQNVLDEYVKWANGECYGIVVVTYINKGTADDPTWEQVGPEDASWGYIGCEWAEEAMLDVFNDAVGSARGQADQDRELDSYGASA